MPSFNELPTREQIAAIDDVAALEDIRDEIDRAVARIEADLEYSDRDDEWAQRARNSLALHKYIDTLIGRRLRDLRPKKIVQPNPQMAALAKSKQSGRKRNDCSAFSQAALDGEIIDPDTVPDELPALETALSIIGKQLAALRADKDDELLNYDQEVWDQEWLLRIAAATRRCGAVHQALLRRAAPIRKREKVADHAKRNLNRPEAFVEAAREVLDRDTFLAIWEVVDRRMPLAEKAA